MKLWIFSDLHLELETHDGPRQVPDADVAVVAGDVAGSPVEAVRWLHERVGRRLPVVYVPGNHEYWRSGPLDLALADGIREARRLGIHLLHGSSVTLDGVRFVGGTLWTDYALFAAGEPGRPRDLDIMHAMRACGGLFLDHVRITRGGGEYWQPEDARRQHKETLEHIERHLAAPFAGPTVVVSHHAPHPAAVGEAFADSVLSAAYVSDLRPVLERHRPALWVHGHVHHTVDERHGSTRVLANPRGYGTSPENAEFDPAMVVEV